MAYGINRFLTTHTGSLAVYGDDGVGEKVQTTAENWLHTATPPLSPNRCRDESRRWS